MNYGSIEERDCCIQFCEMNNSNPFIISVHFGPGPIVFLNTVGPVRSILAIRGSPF